MEISLFDSAGRKLDAFVSEEQRGDWIDYTFRSRGGKKGSKNERNPEYLSALETFLELLRLQSGVIQDILVVSSKLESLPVANRRVIPFGRAFPIELGSSDDMVALRKEITKAAAKIGRAPNARGPGNPTKKIRITVSLPGRGSCLEMDNINLSSSQRRQANLADGPSGPPPSDSRKGSVRQVSRGTVYALSLKGVNRPAIKIGFSSNLDKRIQTLNREIHPVLTNCHWKLLDSWHFKTERDAYDVEQKLNLFLRDHIYEGEREVFCLSKSQFKEKFAAFKKQVD